MATAAARTPTLVEVLSEHTISASRILLSPTPGTATEIDVERVNNHEHRLCELIDGTLVEKTMGSEESRLAIRLAQWLLNFMDIGNLGEVLGADGMI